MRFLLLFLLKHLFFIGVVCVSDHLRASVLLFFLNQDFQKIFDKIIQH